MQSVSSTFQDLAESRITPISWGLRISFKKQFDASVTFFILDQSVLNGMDVLGASNDDPIQEWSKYAYDDMTDRSISLEYERELDFPYSVSAAMADFTLNNYDDLLTPRSSSPLSDYVLPSRPIRMLMGYGNETLQEFVGLTDGMPTIDDKTKTVSFHAVDFMTRIFGLKTPSVLAMQDVTTDEVLSVLFQAAGLLPSQYDIPEGRNMIRFVYYQKGVSMGTVIRDLMEAEMGQLWLDEAGVIRFIPRLELPSDAAIELDESTITYIKTSNGINIINSVIINAKIRDIQDKQPIWTLSDISSDDYIVSAGSSKDVWVQLSDPTTSITDPILDGVITDSYFNVTTLSGDPTSGVSVSSTDLFVDSYKVTFANGNAFDIRISQAQLWGTPAKIIDEIKYIRVDQDSIDKYEEQSIELNNDFVQSIDACDSIAYSLLDSYAEFSGDIEMKIKGTPALQLGDIVDVTKDTFTGLYRIKKITGIIESAEFQQYITAQRYNPRDYFILDVSVLNGPTVLAP